ncbi:hypothetical protein YUYDRAFT_02115 [Streptomyces sp. ScaeMP-e48]|uniref:hypothetical protein n=1 Tax=Streptomyces sp. ScaeMP-e48 TaxID=1100823 RepID=UPI000823AAA5|nr:hypothetical protein [Streptomyces sp. ScaeMP-e48]SCK20311.1 hypothetical protein YUYDRAFT_02115 [Streptomyces sp. ScaeMP-e48]
MTEQPYTPDDLTAEAARQHYLLTAHLNSRQVLGRLLNATVQSTLTQDSDTGLTWREVLTAGGFDETTAAITDLIRGAADVSAWAIQLGADGLQPEDHTLTVDGDGRPLVRLHCAFAPEVDDAARAAFMNGLSHLIAEGL